MNRDEDEESAKMPMNPLRSYFDRVTEGPGIWKWLHYFDIYHRHLARFVDQEVVVVEVGVYSGGSLAMWRDYFGPCCHIHGIDIQEVCQAYSGDRITIHVGNQADRSFWQRFRDLVPRVDILIDDGGHQPEQQRITCEEMLPHLSAGGVYICEDIHCLNSPFSAFVHRLADGLNAHDPLQLSPGTSFSTVTPLQSDLRSVHLYPYVVVVEKNDRPLERLVAEKRGTQWQRFM